MTPDDVQRRFDELAAELELLHAHIAANEWKRTQDRFHSFDSIKDDMCPACGGPVVVEATARHVKLKARA